MMRLIPLPERGKPDVPRLWINPEHITSIAPVLERFVDEAGERLNLSVDLKLQGLPLTRNWLAMCADSEEADARWQGFLEQLQGPAGAA